MHSVRDLVEARGNISQLSVTLLCDFKHLCDTHGTYIVMNCNLLGWFNDCSIINYCW